MTKEKQQRDLNAFIEKEMRSLAAEYFEELWDEIEDANLDIEVVGAVLIERVLAKVAERSGEESASKLVSHISKLDEMGTLAGKRVLQ